MQYKEQQKRVIFIYKTSSYSLLTYISETIKTSDVSEDNSSSTLRPFKNNNRQDTNEKVNVTHMNDYNHFNNVWSDPEI